MEKFQPIEFIDNFRSLLFFISKKERKKQVKKLVTLFCNRIENAILIFLHRNIVIAGLFSPSLLL